MGSFVFTALVRMAAAARRVDWAAHRATLAREVRRMAASTVRFIHGEVRVVDGRLVASDRALWVFWSALLLGAIQLHQDAVTDTIAVICGTGMILLVRWWRHRGQKRWRETGGRMNAVMTGEPDAATGALISELQKVVPGAVPAIEAIGAAMRANRALSRDNAVRVNALEEQHAEDGDIANRWAAALARIDALETTVAANRQRIDSLVAALAEAYMAAGHRVPVALLPDEPPTGPMMRVIHGGRSDLSAG